MIEVEYVYFITSFPQCGELVKLKGGGYGGVK